MPWRHIFVFVHQTSCVKRFSCEIVHELKDRRKHLDIFCNMLLFRDRSFITGGGDRVENGGSTKNPWHMRKILRSTSGVYKWRNLTLMWAHLPLFGPSYLTFTLVKLVTFDLDPVTFNLDPCDLRPFGHMSNTLCKTRQTAQNINFLSGDLDLWPMTLTLNANLDIIQIHLHTKFHDPRCYSYRNMNYCLVNFGPVTDRRTESDA